jgi:hypothetical protein
LNKIAASISEVETAIGHQAHCLHDRCRWRELNPLRPRAVVATAFSGTVVPSHSRCRTALYIQTFVSLADLETIGNNFAVAKSTAVLRVHGINKIWIFNSGCPIATAFA